MQLYPYLANLAYIPADWKLMVSLLHKDDERARIFAQ